MADRGEMRAKSFGVWPAIGESRIIFLCKRSGYW